MVRGLRVIEAHDVVAPLVDARVMARRFGGLLRQGDSARERRGDQRGR